MTTFTTLERRVLAAFFDNAREECGAETVGELLDDNFSWIEVPEIEGLTGLGKHQIAALLGSLMQKGAVGADEKEGGGCIYCIADGFLHALRNVAGEGAEFKEALEALD